MGVSAYENKQRTALDLTDGTIEKLRSMIGGGQLSPPPTTTTRWYLSDLERAVMTTDGGDMRSAARLWTAMRGDGTAYGLRHTLSSGIVRLPRRLYGDKELADALDPRNGTRGEYDDLIPPAEAALGIDDGVGLGVSVGELVPVQGRDFPVYVRLEPEYLTYRWATGRWYYRSIAGLIEVTPGDGRWVLHVPGGRVNPWRTGVWRAAGRAYINKDHALAHRSNFGSKLANPARAATAPVGATEEERTGFLSRIIAWGVNTVFELPVGWDVKLIESNGRGYEVFKDEIATSDQELMIAIAGQVVTTTGGSGFVNMDLFQLVRNDIIQAQAAAWAHTVNTQILPYYAFVRRGAAWESHQVTCELVATAPKDHQREATTMVSVGNGIAQANAALGPAGLKVEEKEVLTRFDIPFRAMTPEEKAERAQAQQLSPTESAQKIEADAGAGGRPVGSEADKAPANSEAA